MDLKLIANTIRGLSMDGVQAANSGHPGMPMGMADVAAVLWTQFLKHNPQNPQWADRDRFVLSAGHGSMLLYSLLHLAGYPLPLEELKKFRQWGSKTPGHPEYGHTVGVETTTGRSASGAAKLPAIRNTATPSALKPPPARSARVAVMPSVWRLPKKCWRRASTARRTSWWITTPT